MSITITNYTKSETDKDITRPYYLIQINFDQATIRWSTGPTVSWNGNFWSTASTKQPQFNKASNGEVRGSIVFVNLDKAILAIIDSEGILDKTIKIWKIYGEGPFSIEDPILYLEGFMRRAVIGTSTAQIEFGSENARVQFAPRLRLGPPIMNHNVAPGTIIETNNGKLILESSRNG